MRLDRELTCAQVVEIVTAYLEDELSGGDRERVEEHLVSCDGCWTYLDQMRQAFGAAVLARTRTRFGAVAGLAGYAGDTQQHLATGRVPLAAFAAARAAEVSGGPAEYERERSRQAAWLAERLGLGAT